MVDRKIASVPWVVLGCGYSGERLARTLVAAGAEVVVTRRDRAAAAAVAAAVGATGCAVDLAAARTLVGVIPRGAVVVVSAPPVAGDVSPEQHLVAAAETAGAGRIVYLSSTGVYPRGDADSWVDEDVAPDPVGARGEARVAAEQVVLAAAVPAVVLRIAAIYGPGRGVQARLAAGTYRVVGDGDSYVSRVHVDDLGQAIVAAGTVDPLPGRVYNVADDEPTTSRAFADAVAGLLGVAPPPSVPLDQVSPAVASMLGANRRVSNARLKRALGVVLSYPTWREGVAHAIAEERRRTPERG